MTSSVEPGPGAPLCVAFCVPELKPFQTAMAGDPADPAYLLLGQIARGLAERGHRLTYVAQRDLGHDVCTTDLSDPRPVIHAWSDSRWFEITSKASWRFQRAVGIPYLNVFSNLRLYDACLRCLPGHDVVYERNGLYRGAVATACKRLGLPYVLFVDADEILEHDYMKRPITGLLRWRVEQVFRHNLARANRIICVSEASKQNLVKRWGAQDTKVVALPNGVDGVRFRPSAELRATARATLGLKENPIVLFVGSFYEWHDVATLVEAFALVLRSQPEARAVLVGDGNTRAATEHLAATLGVAHAVRFTGPVRHAAVPALVNAADVAIVPYPAMKHALWLSPMKLYEYMASATAIVATAAGQILEVMEDGASALLVPAGDTVAMATAIQRLIEDPGLRARLGNRARQDALERHSWERYVSSLERVFEDVVAERTGGSP